MPQYRSKSRPGKVAHAFSKKSAAQSFAKSKNKRARAYTWKVQKNKNGYVAYATKK